jgi:hypothetical protein
VEAKGPGGPSDLRIGAKSFGIDEKHVVLRGWLLVMGNWWENCERRAGA